MNCTTRACAATRIFSSSACNAASRMRSADPALRIAIRSCSVGGDGGALLKRRANNFIGQQVPACLRVAYVKLVVCAIEQTPHERRTYSSLGLLSHHFSSLNHG